MAVWTVDENHWLRGESVEEPVASGNRGGAFREGDLDTIVIHYTAGPGAASAIRTLTDLERKASAHLVIGRDNTVTQLVPFNAIAWHAGRSSHGGREGLNRYSIGIEIDNAGQLRKNGAAYLAWFGRSYPEEEVFSGVHRNQTQLTCWHRYTEGQIEAVESICAFLVKQYGIRHILGHEEISPKRKIDPGPAFPLDKMRDRLLDGNRDADESEPADAVDIAFEGNRVGAVTAGKLNIRTAPSPESPKAGLPLEKGTQVKILEEAGGWYRVKVETECWVSKEYIERVV